MPQSCMAILRLY